MHEMPRNHPERNSGRPLTARRQPDLLGISVAMADVRDRLKRFAPLEADILVTGETGTGKELVARLLHAASPRATGPFVAMNVAAIPESLLEAELFGYAPGAFTGARREGHRGKFLQASGGTLFLDEVGEMSSAAQSKLLRVLQEREVDVVGGDHPYRVDVRVLAATHRPLGDLVREGTFRADLFYRLNVLMIILPSLRERPSDIPVLTSSFVREICLSRHRVPPKLSCEVLDAFAAYPWPGNVRELRNALEYALAFADGPEISLRHLPPALIAREQESGPPRSGLRESEILTVLAEVGGNKSEAARRLKISRSGLYYRLRGAHPR